MRIKMTTTTIPFNNISHFATFFFNIMNTHTCTETSECRFYNSEHMLVCSVTGKCYRRRLCDDYVDSSRGIGNSVNATYSVAQKRNQQIKNRKIEIVEIMNIINDIQFLKELSRETINDFAKQIIEFWKVFIDEIEKKDFYVHRNARRCFVVSIIYNLKNGLHTLGGCVILAHPSIQVTNLNKKKTYKYFKIRDIRYGQNIIKKVMEDRSFVPIKLNFDI